ncbi:MAG: hypothetical protein GKR90_05655 [Pseudomonadales bacterium]|nr:hypothetical protein [Pseudomonadales bacterium]
MPNAELQKQDARHRGKHISLRQSVALGQPVRQTVRVGPVRDNSDRFAGASLRPGHFVDLHI